MTDPDTIYDFGGSPLCLAHIQLIINCLSKHGTVTIKNVGDSSVFQLAADLMAMKEASSESIKALVHEGQSASSSSGDDHAGVGNRNWL